MAADELHVGDIGTTFVVTIVDGTAAVNVSSAGTLQLLFKKPNGELLTKTASLNTDGEDGKIKYLTVAGDLDIKGRWRMQGYVVIGASQWHSDIVEFQVFPNLS